MSSELTETLQTNSISEAIPISSESQASPPSTISLGSPQDDSEFEPPVSTSTIGLLTTSTITTATSCSKSLSTSSRRSPEVLNGSVSSRRMGIDFAPEDVTFLSELGRGYGGIVCKIQSKSSGFLIVQKTFQLEIKTSMRSQMLRDLQILTECSSPFITIYYGASYISKTSISIYMEYMDAGGLDTLLPKVGRIPEPILVHIADSLVKGLLYLWQELHIMHRNLKPSNILVTRSGSIKISDFVVCPQMFDALASAFVATRIYLAPERLIGEPITPSSDIWSFGVTLMELAIGCFPFPALDPVDFVKSFAPELASNMEEHRRAALTGEALSALNAAQNSDQLTLFELITHIVERPPPRLAAYCFSPQFVHLVHSCLDKDPVNRLGLEILHHHILPPLISKVDGEFTVSNWLDGIFNREQAEAIDAVVLAVGDDFDQVVESSDKLLNSWNLPSTGSRFESAVTTTANA